jgi:hypothetical protein
MEIGWTVPSENTHESEAGGSISSDRTRYDEIFQIFVLIVKHTNGLDVGGKYPAFCRGHVRFFWTPVPPEQGTWRRLNTRIWQSSEKPFNPTHSLPAGPDPSGGCQGMVCNKDGRAWIEMQWWCTLFPGPGIVATWAKDCSSALLN